MRIGQAEEIAKAKNLGMADYIVTTNTPPPEVARKVKTFLDGAE